jgi:hypothetical protein
MGAACASSPARIMWGDDDQRGVWMTTAHALDDALSPELEAIATSVSGSAQRTQLSTCRRPGASITKPSACTA